MPKEVLAGGGAGATALTSHAIKAGLRLGINASPEPFSNINVSLGEDGTVALVVALALKEPLIALGIVVVLLAIGVGLLLVMRKGDPAGAREPARAQGALFEEGPPLEPPGDPPPRS